MDQEQYVEAFDDTGNTAAINCEQVEAIAATVRVRFRGSTPRPARWDDPAFWNVDGTQADRCQFLTVGNAINFRFWSIVSGQIAWSAGPIEGELFSGSMYLWRRLRVGVSRGEFRLDAKWLSELTEDMLARAFSDDNGQCPLGPGLAERVENLRDLGMRLLGRWQGQFVNIVHAAHGSLERFSEISATFRAFDDPVRKLTMVNAIMLSGSGLASFDEEPLPGIDYHLPKEAVRQGIVVPSGRLAEKLRNGILLAPEESLALRQATLTALLKVAEQSNVSTAVIDNLYWGNGKICVDRKPACQVADGPECPFEEACAQHVHLGPPLEVTRYY